LKGKLDYLQFPAQFPFDYEKADHANVIYETWADAFSGDPAEGCEPKECKSFVGDCVGDKFTTLEKPWKFEIKQEPDGILSHKYCYQCTAESGQTAT
jgi:hypothetical protein